MDQLEAIERRRRNLRIVLFVIILATLPFYCAGILLWGSAPPRARPATTATTAVLQTRTLVTSTPIQIASITPLQSTLASTPGQFFTFAPPTRILSPTPLPVTPTDFIFPTSTPAPTLTAQPTLTPAPTETPVPIPTDTAIPIPTDTPIPDSDGDGIPDNLDACPFIPGPPPSGCPPTDTPSLGEPPIEETIIPPGP